MSSADRAWCGMLLRNSTRSFFALWLLPRRDRTISAKLRGSEAARKRVVLVQPQIGSLFLGLIALVANVDCF
jgi:hypothetical protein